MATALVPAILIALAAQAAQTPPPPPAFRVEIIETTPLAGVDLPLEAIPSPAQTALDTDIRASGALDVSDFLNRRLANVFVNEIQGNPLQADVSFRGYTASPLLGTPQGLSVYMDGVRLNQPFGDVVSWDLIPRVAVASTTMMPGSNPVFGLNTLGGALAVQTKDGRSHPGTSVQLTGGSYGRRAIEFEHGRQAKNGFDWYAAGNLFHDGGWRPLSASDVRQVFGKIGWRDSRTELHVTGAYADNVLNGNGLQELRLLASDYASVYTTPDTTTNHAGLVNLTIRRSLTREAAVSIDAYYRDIRTATVNGDVNEASLDQNVYAAGENGANTPFPFRRCLQQVAARDEPGEKCTGLMNRTDTAQRNYGVSGQLNLRQTIERSIRARNQFTAGGAFDRSTVGFLQTTELGYVNPERGITPLGVFADGASAGTIDGEPYDNRVDLDGVITTASAFATDTMSIADAWHVTLSGRFNQTTVRNLDRITPAGVGSLTGDHTFTRFNPAAGVTFSPSRQVNLYAGYSEGSRAPTSIELGCADPRSPCKLPNALIGDPPLDQVVTHTWEGGVRGGTRRFHWSAGVFRATNSNDVLFVAATETGFGYFRNFGETRRRGFEASVSATRGRVSSGGSYALTAATYETREALTAPSNSSNAAGTIAIAAGDRIPLIPRHTMKAWVDIQATRKIAFDVDGVANSGAPARGNENGVHQADGVRYLGPGSTPGYAVIGAGARVTLTRRLQAVAQLNNIFNQRYYSAAQLGPAAFTTAGVFVTRGPSSTFYAPGAPATFWAGLRVIF